MMKNEPEKPAMDVDRSARTLADLRREEVRESLRAVGLIERCGMWSHSEAGTWLVAGRAMLAELSEPGPFRMSLSRSC
jgi:hypothetical protein